MAKNLKLTFGYEDTEDTRQYNFDVADSVDATCKNSILAINNSLKAGTAGGLSSFFVSDNGDNFSLITAAQLEETETIVLDLNIAGDSAASLG